MKILFKKVIIYFFEKYAQDYWIQLQCDIAQQEISEKYDIPMEEVYDFCNDEALDNRIDSHKQYAREQDFV